MFAYSTKNAYVFQSVDRNFRAPSCTARPEKRLGSHGALFV